MPNARVILVRYESAPADASAQADRLRDVVARAKGISTIRQCEAYASADTDGAFLLYADGEDAIESLIAAAGPGERSDWRNAASFYGSPENTIDPSTAPQHVTLVRQTLKPGMLASLVDECRDDMNATTGIKRFDINAAADDDTKALICARWADRAAWEHHNAQPGYAAMGERLGALMAAPPQRTLWKALASVRAAT